MAYEYDVFISYRSKSKGWLSEIFLPDFTFYLEEEVGMDPKIFVDWHDVRVGDAWEERIKQGLLTSKCLISLLMPSYFESDWCTREFAVFEHRSIQHGMLSLEKPGGLIIPIALHDSEVRPFPESVVMKQTLDFKRFFYPNYEGFKKRKMYPLLVEELKALVKTVAQIIQQAPDWNPNWQQNDWLEVPTNHLRLQDFIAPQPRI